jgi:hypothetical protein
MQEMGLQNLPSDQHNLLKGSSYFSTLWSALIEASHTHPYMVMQPETIIVFLYCLISKSHR